MEFSPTHQDNERGTFVPPEQDIIIPDSGGEIPEQVTAEHAQDTYEIPPQHHDSLKEEKTSRLKLIVGGIAVAVTSAVAASAIVLGMKDGEDDRKAAPEFGTQPTVSAEQVPGTSAAPSSPDMADTYGASPEHSLKEQIKVGSEVLSLEQAKASLFTITTEEAPTFDAAVDAYTKALTNGMNMNTDRSTISQMGGNPKTAEDMNFDLLTGEDGLLLSLGSNHNEVSTLGTTVSAYRYTPGTLVWAANKRNIEQERASEVVILPSSKKVTKEGNGYMMLATIFVTEKTQGTGDPLDSKKFDMELHAKQVDRNGVTTWDFSGTDFLPPRN